MRNRTAIAAVFLIALCLATFIFVVHFGSDTYLDIEQSEIQQRLDAKFPIRNCALLVACLELSKPVVSLSNGSDRIGFSAETVVGIGRHQFPGQVQFAGKLRYVRYEGDFFIDAIEIRDLKIAGVPPEFTEVVKVRGPKLIGAVLEARPIYSLKNDSTKEALAKLALRDVEVVNGKLRITFVQSWR